MSKQEDVKFLKIQTCVLKVNIHCEGCKQKVKKLLQKIDGVYTTSIDAEQGRVTVTGNVDPSILIKKLHKNGKHAELWGSKGDKNQPNKQDKGQKGGKPQKGDKEQNGKNQLPQPQQQQPLQLPQLKGMQDLNLPQFNAMNLGLKGPKHVQFGTPDDVDEFGSDEYGSEDYDDDDDELDGGDLHDPLAELMKKMKLPMSGNGMMMGDVPPSLMHASQAMDGKKGGGNGGGNGKKGGGADVNVQQQNKGMGGGNDAKNGNGGKKGGGNNGGGNQNQGGGGAPKNGGKNGGPQDNKNGGGNNKNANGGGGGGNNNGASGKKGGGGGGGGPMNNVGQGQPVNMGLGVQDMNLAGGVNLAQMGRMNPMAQMGGQMGHQLGQMGNVPAPGLPTGPPAMNPNGYFQGAGPEIMAGNPYHQQQYMAAMMAQQRLNGDERFQPMMYSRPPAAVAYYPQPPPYSGYFSEENPSGCSLM